MKTRTWIIGCAATFLASCASLPASDVRPANDLELLRLGVQELTRERQPTGPVQRVEDAERGEQLFTLAVALEDTNWLQNDDKARTRRFVDAATRRIELARVPSCRWFDWRCHRERRRITRALDAATAPP